jgi:membrane protein DedA with SNARE-associated domain
MGMIDFIAHLAPGTLYPGIFIGIIFAGGLVLLPSMYVAMTGTLSLLHLFFISIAAGLTMETFWYTVGTSAKKEKIYALPFVKKRVDEAKKFSSFFNKHGVLLVFVSKFIYGTRIASHVLAGMHKLNFLKYISATTLGTVIWFGIFYGLLKTADLGISGVKETTTKAQLIFLIVACTLVCLNWFTGTYLRRRIMKG